MAEPITRPGGQVLWSTNERITSADLNRMGLIAGQALFDLLLARMFRDEVNGQPRSGLFASSDCEVSVVTGLSLSVAIGFGLLWAPDVADPFGLLYRPIVLSGASSVTLDAHDADPRIDLLCIAPATVDAEQSTRQIYDPASGQASPETVYTLRKFSSTVQVVKGTPAATPVAPALPSGYLALAHAAVPAVSGAVTLTDRRRLLRLARSLEADPPTEYVEDHTSEDGETTADGTSMETTTSAGIVVIGGVRRNFVETVLVHEDADPALTRYDLVVVDRATGEPEIVEGVPGEGQPVVPPNKYLGAIIEIPPGALVIEAENVTDGRVFEPYNTDQIRDGAITQAKAQQGRTQGLLVTAQDTPDLTIRVAAGLANVGGTNAFFGGNTGLAVSQASAGKEKVGILQIANDGTVSIKYGAEVNKGSGLAQFPAADAGQLAIVRVGTPATPIQDDTTQVTQAMVNNTVVRTWF